MERTAVYPGTFDPITLGHLDVIKTSSAIFDKVVVGLLINPAKKPMFAEQERILMIKESVEECGINNIMVKPFRGLAVEFARQEGSNIIIRGLRLTTEYEEELNISFNNRVLDEGVYTIFVAPLQQHVHISSSAVRAVLSFGGINLDKYLPRAVIAHIIGQRK